MGKTDKEMKAYLSDNRRYADLWNGGLFQGRQLICPEDLRESLPAVFCAEEGVESSSDLAMKQFQGNQVLALWLLENQETTDFSMPARVMVAEALQYSRQLRDIRKKNLRKYQQSRRKMRNADAHITKITASFYTVSVPRTGFFLLLRLWLIGVMGNGKGRKLCMI